MQMVAMPLSPTVGGTIIVGCAVWLCALPGRSIAMIYERESLRPIGRQGTVILARLFAANDQAERNATMTLFQEPTSRRAFMAGIGLAGFSLAAPASAEETVGSPAEWRLPLQR